LVKEAGAIVEKSEIPAITPEEIGPEL